MKNFIPAIMLLIVLNRDCVAAEPLAWPRFRGPNGTGIADHEHPPVDIGPTKNVLWKVPVPNGLSSPIVVGNMLVITGFEQEKLFTIAYRRADGSELWRAEAPLKQLETYHKQEGSPAASTPATDGERIVSYFGSCGLVCYDLSGQELWRFEMPPANTAGSFGTGVSPILEDGLVVLVRDATQDAKIMALDAGTGSLKWQTPRSSPVSWCTPVVWDTPTGKQVVAAGHAWIVGYDLASGTELWSVNGTPSGCCTSPVASNGKLYFAGWSPGASDDAEFQSTKFDDQLKELDADHDGKLSRSEAEKTFEGFFDTQDMNHDGFVTREEYDLLLQFMAAGSNQAFAIKSGGRGDISASHVLWQQTKGLPYVASAILCRGQFVMVKDGGIVTAYDAETGNEIFSQRAAAGGRYYASPVTTNEHVYLTSRDDGVVTVLRAGAANGEIVVQNPPLGEQVAATPAIADDTLYIRTDKHLYAFAEIP